MDMKILCEDWLIGFIYDKIRKKIEKGETRFMIEDKIVSVISDENVENVRVVKIELR